MRRDLRQPCSLLLGRFLLRLGSFRKGRPRSSGVRTFEMHDLPASKLRAERHPCRHELASVLEKIAAPVGRLDLLPMVWASAISTTSLGKLDRSAAQSRNAERKPCAVTSTFSRRSVISNAMTESGCPGRAPGNTQSPVLMLFISSRIAKVCGASGTRCSRAALMQVPSRPCAIGQGRALPDQGYRASNITLPCSRPR